MRSSLLPPLAGLLLFALTAPAAAQSGPPGNCQCAPAPTYPMPYASPAYAAPGYAAPYYVVETAPEPWQSHRFGLGLRLGGASVATADPEQPEDYSTLGLTARYRVSRRWEIELAVDHGQLDNGDGTMGPAEFSAGTISALLHLRPQARWDWYLLGGLGTSERRPYADSDWAEERSHLALGIGLERRFEHLVIGAELRGLAQPPAEEPVYYSQPEPASSSGIRDPGPSGMATGSGAAQATLHATWYF